MGRTVVLDRYEGCTVLRLDSAPPKNPALSGSLSLISVPLGEEVAKPTACVFYLLLETYH